MPDCPLAATEEYGINCICLWFMLPPLSNPQLKKPKQSSDFMTRSAALKSVMFNALVWFSCFFVMTKTCLSHSANLLKIKQWSFVIWSTYPSYFQLSTNWVFLYFSLFGCNFFGSPGSTFLVLKIILKLPLFVFCVILSSVSKIYLTFISFIFSTSLLSSYKNFGRFDFI